ncbi:MAG TPA: hypothetical protein VFY45_13515 [Baekduia sp.]|nr:hypothetical protein [Baekduia sp.]
MSDGPPDDGVLPDGERLPAGWGDRDRAGWPALTPRQTSIAEELEARTPQAASWFVSAVELLQTRAPVAWVSLVAHLCRDLMNRTPRIADVVVEGQEERDKPGRVEYPGLVDGVDSALSAGFDGSQALSPEAMAALVTLIDRHRKLKRKLAEPLRAPNPAESEVARREFDRQWRETQRFFLRLAHLGRDKVATAPAADVVRRFEIMEHLLATLLRAVPYWTMDGELREIAELDSPSVGDLRRAMVLWRGDAEKTFFDNLTSPVWVPLIVEARFLDEPLGIEVSDEGTRLPYWPVADYLKRVAGEAPDAVLAAIERLGPTENGRVHDDLVQALAEMPAATAARAVKLVVKWLGQTWGRFAAESAAGLAERLADGGEPDAALALAKKLVSIQVDVVDRDGGLGPRIVFRTVFHGDWEYDDALSELLPALVAVKPVKVVELLAGELSGVLAGECRRRDEEGPEDNSYWWRKSIADHAQDSSRDDARDHLVTLLRDAAVAAAQTSADAADAVLAALDRQPHLIFRRMTMHLVRVVEAPGSGFGERRRRDLLDRSRFDSPAYRNEYFHLAHDRFGELSEEDQGVVFGWIDEGPDLIGWEGRGPGPPTEEEKAERADWWRYERLTPLEPHLTGARAAQYAGYVERFGKLADPDIVNPIYVGWSQPSARYSPGDLKAMSPDDLITAITTYVPDTDSFPPEAENGLASVLSTAIGEDPAYWKPFLVTVAERLPDAYVGAALDALSMPKDGADDDWDPILALAEHALQRDGGDEQRRLARAAGRAVEAAVRSINDASAQSARVAQIMRLLRRLLDDPDPNASLDASYATRPVSGALNAVRPRALEALVNLALRLRADARTITHPSLAHMPEVQELLERHLDPDQEPSPLVRAEYGARLGQLLYLDQPWATAQIPVIFDGASPDLADAAWRGYVIRSFLRTTVIEPVLATGMYSSHLPILRRVSTSNEHLEEDDLREQLIKHIAYAWAFDVTGADELLGSMQATAADANNEAFVRELAFGLLREGDDEVLAPAIQRLVDHWRRRIDALDGDSSELSSYSWWYSSGRLPEPEAIALLIDTINKTGGRLDDVRGCLDRAAAVAESHADRAADLLAAMLGATHGREELNYTGDRIPNLLKAITATRTPALDARVTKLINELGEEGIGDYRGFLPDAR